MRLRAPSPLPVPPPLPLFTPGPQRLSACSSETPLSQSPQVNSVPSPLHLSAVPAPSYSPQVNSVPSPPAPLCCPCSFLPLIIPRHVTQGCPPSPLEPQLQEDTPLPALLLMCRGDSQQIKAAQQIRMKEAGKEGTCERSARGTSENPQCRGKNYPVDSPIFPTGKTKIA